MRFGGKDMTGVCVRALFSGALYLGTLFLDLGSGSGAVFGQAPPARDAHPIVPGFERFFAADGSDALRGGQLLLSELNCTSCHQVEAAAKDWILPRPAPRLEELSSRVRPEYLIEYLAHPHVDKAGTVMPDLLATLPAAERKAAGEALAHFLISLTPGSLTERLADKGAIGRGEKLFHTVGCTVCHQPEKGQTAPLATSIPLGDVGAKYTVPSLATFLRDPLRTRPSGRMPSLNLNEKEAQDLASYFLRNSKLEGNVKYAYYEGTWDNVPDFDKLKPNATGESAGFDLGVARRQSNYGLRFEGYMNVFKQGNFLFHLGSDDGSKLWINNQLIVSVDGIHPLQTKVGRMPLEPGSYPVKLDFFQQGGGAELALEYEGGGVTKQPLAGVISLTNEGLRQASPGFDLQPALVEKGRAMFSSLGCAACHSVKSDNKNVPNLLVSKRLAETNPTQGCLAETPSGKAPRYDLNVRQRKALQTALEHLRGPGAQPLAPEARIALTMTTFNCYACHTRGQIGGPEPERNTLFQTTMPEMGDEGRIPPPLDGVGNKLQESWLKQLFNNGAQDRPYMLARMPKFGGGNLPTLTEDLAKVDAVPATPLPSLDDPVHRIKSAGRYMVGGKAFSCIKCHNFAGNKAQGIQSIDLTTMTKRLREDWFQRYMSDPQTYRPGTRMPSAWPKGKQSLLTNFFEGNSEKQIRAVWTYLADAGKAALPEGLLASTIDLTPWEEPVMYRNFIEGAGSRAIGVGYPERANLAFDAENLRLALIWHGSFIDASRHWNGRGAGYQPPLGDDILPLPANATFAQLDSVTSPWPTQPARQLDGRFQGYHLDAKRRPTFLYRMGPIEVSDLPEPLLEAGQRIPALQRTLLLKSVGSVERYYYRAAVASKIEPSGDHEYLIDGQWKIKLETSGPPPIVRSSGNQTELLVPVAFTDGKARIVQTYHW